MMEYRHTFAIVSHPQRTVLSLLLLTPCALAAFISEPRWGQAVALLNDKLFIHGGKTDQFNAYSYTGAPTSNDLFYLDLSSSFDPSSPPWNYVSGTQESSSIPQGPTLAWHTLSAFNDTHLLLFGGDGGPNSPIVLPNQNDSAVLLDVGKISTPSWSFEPENWANQPSRRIHHSTSTSSGKVYLIGGEKDDGSGIGFSDHYVFDPAEASFTQLPVDGGPSDIYGHTSILLPDGRLLVLGGYSQSSNEPIPLTTIWSIDTLVLSPSWSTVQISNTDVPSTRRAFASTWVEGFGVLIHGGADEGLQSSLSDGWLLNTSSDPMIWSNISTLSTLGQRRDHFAVSIGSQVVFGFGYAQNSGASVSLSVFDLERSSFVNSFVPQSTPTQTTLAGPSGTTSSSGSDSITFTGTNHGSGPQQTNGSNGTDSSDPTDGEHEKNSVVAIAVGSVLGVVAFSAAVVVCALAFRRHRQFRQQFRLISDDDSNSPASEPQRPPGYGWTAAWLGIGKGEKTRLADQEQGRGRYNLGQKFRGNQHRIDMFAHEDSSTFFGSNDRRLGSGSSKSWYSIHETNLGRFNSYGSRPTLGRLLSGSLHSLRNVGAAVGLTSGIRRVTSDQTSSLHREKREDELPLDPFGDNVDKGSHTHFDVLTIEASNCIIQASAPRSSRDILPKDSRFLDPFEDQDECQILSRMPSDSTGQKKDERGDHTILSSYSRQLDNDFCSRSTLSIPLDLSVLMNTPSKASSSTAPSSSATLGINNDRNQLSSNSSLSRENLDALSISTSPRPRTLSIINTSTSPTHMVKRSDSWWGRMKRASFRESLYDHPHQPSAKSDFEFRDPNPPPGRLGAIHEASGSGSSARMTSPVDSDPSSEPNLSSFNSRKSKQLQTNVYSSSEQRSTTSLKTSRTADSEALERLGGRVDVAHREATETSLDYTSSLSTNSEFAGEHSSRHPSEVIGTRDVTEIGLLSNSGGSADIVESPIDDQKVFSPFSEFSVSLPLFTTTSDPVVVHDMLPRNKSGVNDRPQSKQSHSSGTVAARVAEYERRMSQDLVSPSSPTKVARVQSYRESPDVDIHTSKPKPKKKTTVVKYGLVQRPELFIANPDHESNASSTS